MRYLDYELGFFETDSATDRAWRDSADLMDAAFHWPIQRDLLEEITRLDERFGTDPIATCATDAEGTVVGYVGMARRTMVVGGERLPTGHVWSVAVRHDHNRRGLGTELMHMALDRFEEEGMAGVTLYTSNALVAYQLYRELEFFDHHRFATWRAPSRKVEGAQPLRQLEEEELEVLGDLYSRAMAGCDGFPERGGEVLKVHHLSGNLDGSWFSTIDPEGSLEGYLCMHPATHRGMGLVLEIVGPDEDWYASAVRSVLDACQGSEVSITHRNPRLATVLPDEGFEWRYLVTHELMMVNDVALAPPGPEADRDPCWFLESQFDVF